MLLAIRLYRRPVWLDLINPSSSIMRNIDCVRTITTRDKSGHQISCIVADWSIGILVKYIHRVAHFARYYGWSTIRLNTRVTASRTRSEVCQLAESVVTYRTPLSCCKRTTRAAAIRHLMCETICHGFIAPMTMVENFLRRIGPGCGGASLRTA